MYVCMYAGRYEGKGTYVTWIDDDDSASTKELDKMDYIHTYTHTYIHTYMGESPDQIGG